MKKGILIVNIGTPESYETKSVAQYLKKFLMDEDVISIPFIFRWILVYLIIVPIRSVKSAAKYKKIWTPAGSPLKVITDQFTQNLRLELPELNIKSGMTFSEPSLKTSLLQFKQENIKQIIICPMFPQYADATTGSILKNIKKIVSEIHLDADLKFIKPFYHQDFYLDEISEVCKAKTASESIKHWIFSYHGLPESQILKTAGCQLNSECCASQKTCTEMCYRSHSVKTTLALAQRLQLRPEQYSMTFQSRLGAKKWLQPYTDQFLIKNSKQMENVAIVCPAFVADCLETLEEIDLENREIFIKSGGLNYSYIPCLNDRKSWVKGFAKYISDEKNLSKL
jgi:protoporphyrin/coproporphyrin ferrochelatase